MSSSPSALTCSDSDSTISTTSSEYSSTIPSCFFDPSTFKRQSFSIPDKIVHYLATNPSNAKVFKKLIQTCKYFFVVNPVIVVPQIKCCNHKWYAFYKVGGKYCVGFKYGQSINFKFWVTEQFCFRGDASQMISSIYKNDATRVYLHNEPLKFDKFLFLAANAKEVQMCNQVVKYENGEIVQLEDIVKNLPKLKTFHFEKSFDGSLNTNTVQKLMEIEHFKHLTELIIYYAPETFDVEGMFNFITKNKQVKVELCYREEIPDAYKELVQQYSNLLKHEEGRASTIEFIQAVDDSQSWSFYDDSSESSSVSSDDEDEDDEDD